MGMGPQNFKAKMKKMHEAASDMIDDNLDTITIVKEISRLKLLVEVLLKPHLLRIEPFVSLSDSRKKEKEKEMLKKRGKHIQITEASKLFPGKTDWCLENKIQMMSFESAMNQANGSKEGMRLSSEGLDITDGWILDRDRGTQEALLEKAKIPHNGGTNSKMCMCGDYLDNLFDQYFKSKLVEGKKQWDENEVESSQNRLLLERK
jgi:hypothetical protein